jgi:hypothetical protein
MTTGDTNISRTTTTNIILNKTVEIPKHWNGKDTRINARALKPETPR